MCRTVVGPCTIKELSTIFDTTAKQSGALTFKVTLKEFTHSSECFFTSLFLKQLDIQLNELFAELLTYRVKSFSEISREFLEKQRQRDNCCQEFHDKKI